ncbi:MAG: hypothetical protein R3F36_15470 [Candidatus Competibacteraceae bacterium]
MPVLEATTTLRPWLAHARVRDSGVAKTNTTINSSAIMAVAKLLTEITRYSLVLATIESAR